MSGKKDKRYQEAVDFLLSSLSSEADDAFWGYVEGQIDFEEFEKGIR